MNQRLQSETKGCVKTISQTISHKVRTSSEKMWFLRFWFWEYLFVAIRLARSVGLRSFSMSCVYVNGNNGCDEQPIEIDNKQWMIAMCKHCFHFTPFIFHLLYTFLVLVLRCFALKATSNKINLWITEQRKYKICLAYRNVSTNTHKNNNKDNKFIGFSLSFNIIFEECGGFSFVEHHSSKTA